MRALVSAEVLRAFDGHFVAPSIMAGAVWNFSGQKYCLL